MGADINSSNDEFGPRVSPDGKFLFFTWEERGKTMDIYRVSTRIIDRLKNEMQEMLRLAGNSFAPTV
jgi:Tol biopolymer transport system component